jgi:DNA polymerase elongation subunit (family B)
MARSFIHAYQCDHNNIRELYIEDGVAKEETIKFKPFLGLHAMKSEDTKWTDIYGKPAKIIAFNSIMEMRNWKKENSIGMEILGDIRPEIQYLATKYRGDIPIQKEGMVIWNIDIEVFCTTGFPHAKLAQHPINAITIHDMVQDNYLVFSTGDYTPEKSNVSYIKCTDEVTLLTEFVNRWSKASPHVITGWNIKTFDIPYIVNRINRILGPDMVKCLSREKEVKQHEVKNSMGQADVTFSLTGHIIWDYIELYRKYCLEPREAYSLDYISKFELGGEKVDYSEYENLADLYTNDFQKFITYNIHDTTLVYELDKKLSFIDLALSIMYTAKCTPDNIFGTVQPWDCIIYNELLKRRVLCPQAKGNTKEDFPGGYVKPPKAGLHKWVMVFDIVSSYPNQIRSFNMSPETILNDHETPAELATLAQKFKFVYDEHERDNDLCPTDEIDDISYAADMLKKHDVCWSANGHFFKRKEEGIVANIYSRVFKERVRLKKLAGQYKREGKPEARAYDLAQQALKILLNSGYGAMSNKHFRYFDIRIASAITTNGQTCCRGVSKYLEKKLPMLSIIYNDTDSIFVSMEKAIESRFGTNLPDDKTVLDFLLKFNEKKVQPLINAYFDELAEAMNMRELTIVMEPECVAKASIHTAKKRYIMNKVWDEGTFMVEHPKLKVRGVEIVRTSSPQWCRDKLREAVNEIFRTLDNDEMIKFIASSKLEFFKQPFEKVAFPRSVTFSDYTLDSKALPIGVRAALTYNKFITNKQLGGDYRLIGDGEKIKFAYIKTPNIIKSDVVGIPNKMPDELAGVIKVDYERQFEKTFLEPMAD